MKKVYFEVDSKKWISPLYSGSEIVLIIFDLLFNIIFSFNFSGYRKNNL